MATAATAVTWKQSVKYKLNGLKHHIQQACTAVQAACPHKTTVTRKQPAERVHTSRGLSAIFLDALMLHSPVIHHLRRFLTGCCCRPSFMRTCPEWFWQSVSHGFKQSSQGSLSLRFFVSVPQWLRLRLTPLSRLDGAFFLPCVHADLPDFADTDFLSFSACRTIENLSPFLCPPPHDAVRMKFMLTCGLATWLMRFNF